MSKGDTKTQATDSPNTENDSILAFLTEESLADTIKEVSKSLENVNINDIFNPNLFSKR